MAIDLGAAMVVECSFVANTAFNGGGVSNQSSDLVLLDCLLNNNSANLYGGGIESVGNTSVLNCLVDNNTAQFGGAIASLDFGAEHELIAINSTLSANSAGVGGGIYSFLTTATVTVVNSVLWENSPREIVDVGEPTTVTFSNVQGGWPGVGNIDAEPALTLAPSTN